MQSLHLRIQGMSCGHCVAAVERALRSAPGVKVRTVAVGSAELEYEPGRVTPQELLQRIGEEGYTAEVA
ncbi:MAG: heavy-metal-associated domain-containing protein [Terriglobales bacterium]